MMLLIGALALMVPQGAMAAWTAACTSITNKATVAFKVGGLDQTPIESSPTGNSTPGVGAGTNTSFKVGNRVNVDVSKDDVAEVSVNPGATNKVLTFTVTNNGNLVQDYSLSAVAKANTTPNPFGGLLEDNFDATGVNVYVEDGTTPGYQSGEDTATRIDELAVGGSIKVYIVVGTIPLTQVNDDLSVYALIATTRDGEGAAAEGSVTTEGAANACGGDAATVFSDGTGDDDAANDGKDSARSAYKVVAVSLNVQKTSAVISDPINGTTSPRAIPGAIVEYTITATYSGGSGSATSLSISDAVPTNTVAKEDVYGGTGEVQRITSDDGGTTPTSTDLANGSDADLVNWGTAAASAIKANCGITLDEAGDYCTIKFRVEIQ